MTLPRAFLGTHAVTPGQRVELDEATAHHLRDVLRMRPGDALLVVDAAGVEHHAAVLACAPFTVVVGDPAQSRCAAASPAVRLLLALLKSDRTELAIQKVTEAGAAEVRVVVCDRSIPRPAPAEGARRLARLQRVATEAARQCGRPVPVRVSLHAGLADAIEDLPGGARFRLDETAGAPALARLLLGSPVAASGVVLAVGPEGSFSPAEVALLHGAGFAPAGLGPRILRAETAAIAAVVIAQATIGDMR